MQRAADPSLKLADYLPRLGVVPLEFQPGARWAYSAAAGFDVLSRIVEVETEGTEGTAKHGATE